MDHYELFKSLCKRNEEVRTYLEKGDWLGLVGKVLDVRDPAMFGALYSALYEGVKYGMTGFGFKDLKLPLHPFRLFTEELNARAIAKIGSPIITALSVHEAYHVVAFEKAGQKTYEVSSGLAQLLMDTELRGLSIEDVRPPYESILVRPPKNLGFQIWSADDRKWYPLESMYFVKEDDGLHILLASPPGPSNDPLDNALCFYDIASEGTELVDELVEAQHKRIRETETTGPMGDVWIKQFKWLLNVVMYISSPESESEERFIDPSTETVSKRLEKAKGTKREKLKTQFRSMNKRRRALLGRNVTVSMVKEAGSKTRVRVRGHWHKYWTGAGRSALVTKWVKPYWKGEGELSNPVVRLVQPRS